MSVAQPRILQVNVPNQDASRVEGVSQQYGISPSSSQSPPLNQFYCTGSRYLNDFVEITKLGKGGFGSVVKVQNKIDGNYYAIKKIIFKNTSKKSSLIQEKVLREVKTLARLDHPNIIRYYQAWIEPFYNNDNNTSDDVNSLDLSHDLSRRKRKTKKNTKKTKSPSFSPRESATFPTTNSQNSVDTVNIEDLDIASQESQGESDHEYSDSISFDDEDSENDDMEDLSRDEISNGEGAFRGPNLNKIDQEKSIDIQWEPNSQPGRAVSAESSISGEQEDNWGVNIPDPYHNGKRPSSASVSEVYNSDINPLRSSTESIQSLLAAYNPIMPTDYSVLYIQMQLCDETLSSYLEKRNSESTVNRTENINILKQVCKGLKYLHAQGIIHRDLKPSNIFLIRKTQSKLSDSILEDVIGQTSEFIVVIGDFGLAVFNEAQYEYNNNKNSHLDIESRKLKMIPSYNKQGTKELSTSPKKQMTTGIGTLTYSSPEQCNQSEYDAKTDVYSLGIIFFEMFSVFGTQMERIQQLSNLRKNTLPKNFLLNLPKESALVMSMIAQGSEDRPTVAEILDEEMFQEADKEVSMSKKELQRLYYMLDQQASLIKKQAHKIKELEQVVYGKTQPSSNTDPL